MKIIKKIAYLLLLITSPVAIAAGLITGDEPFTLDAQTDVLVHFNTDPRTTSNRAYFSTNSTTGYFSVFTNTDLAYADANGFTGCMHSNGTYVNSTMTGMSLDNHPLGANAFNYLTGSMTVDLWVNIDSLPATGKKYFMLGTCPVASANYYYTTWSFAINPDGTLYYIHRQDDGSTGLNGTIGEANSTGAITVGQWYHVAFERVIESGKTTVYFYINKQFDSKTVINSVPVLISTNGMKVKVGYKPYGGGWKDATYAFKGYFDEIRISSGRRQYSNQCADGWIDEIDFNADCIVNFQDFAVFAAEWLQCNNSLDPSCY